MVIVVAIVVVLVTMILPAASSMWRDRKIADAENTISGVLMSTRAKALQPGGGVKTEFSIKDSAGVQHKLLAGSESGLFFFVDSDGVQKIVGIAQLTPEDDRALTLDQNRQIRTAWSNVFTVLAERSYSLPPPMRVVPRRVVCTNDGAAGYPATCNPTATTPDPSYEVYVPRELARNDVFAAPQDHEDEAQRHRNFFTILYSAQGELAVGREVVIRDPDADPTDNPGGDVTGLTVPQLDTVRSYYGKDNAPKDMVLSHDPAATEIDVIVDGDNVALDFPSVDGLLVYDESLFAAAGTSEQKRKYLIENAQPFYVHRLTGAVVRGPAGETVAQTP